MTRPKPVVPIRVSTRLPAHLYAMLGGLNQSDGLQVDPFRHAGIAKSRCAIVFLDHEEHEVEITQTMFFLHALHALHGKF
jgi:hypothetical protein